MSPCQRSRSCARTECPRQCIRACADMPVLYVCSHFMRARGHDKARSHEHMATSILINGHGHGCSLALINLFNFEAFQVLFPRRQDLYLQTLLTDNECI